MWWLVLAIFVYLWGALSFHLLLQDDYDAPGWYALTWPAIPIIWLMPPYY